MTSAVFTKTIAMALLLVGLSATARSETGDSGQADASARLEEGRLLAFDRSKGNCLACHAMAGGELAGNFGPPLMMMKVRYPDRATLRSQVWDATERVPNTTMPPFGRHRILTEEEIDLVVDFLLSL